MKFSIYHKDGKYHIYRNSPKTEGSELPDDKPMYVCDSMDDANEWINGKDVYADYQLYELYDSHSIEFDDDVVRLAQKRFDAYKNEGEKAGWGKLEIDRTWTSHTYRSSADWKNEPLLFTFEQTLKWSSFPSEIDDCTLRIRDNYIMLIGMYDALYEIGRTLTFDTDFKVHLMGGNKVWVMKECY